MATAVTKVERVVEAVESLVVSVNAMQAAVDAHSRRRLFETVQDSRSELREALKEFTAPILRVVA
jgi:hypothetical protein